MMRGMSALKGKGLHKYMKLTVGIKDLPAPVHPSKLTPEVGDENHGLWGFFNNERSLLTLPEDLGNHGRAWTKQELRRKSWEDLHSLWWVCLKERNQLKTEDRERKRLEAGYGDFESKVRVNVIQETMKGIKSVLRERWYNWEDARQLAEEDPEIQVTEDGQVRYTPTIVSYALLDGRQFVANEVRINTTMTARTSSKRLIQRYQLDNKARNHLPSPRNPFPQRRIYERRGKLRNARQSKTHLLTASNPSFLKVPGSGRLGGAGNSRQLFDLCMYTKLYIIDMASSDNVSCVFVQSIRARLEANELY
jgi:large subunit ribosomal protein L47